jgi:hypothetical protein
MKQWHKIALLLVLIFVVDLAFGQGCSQCKALAEQGSGHGGKEITEASFGRNINYGILYLMIIPYILLFFFFRKRILRLFRSLVRR